VYGTLLEDCLEPEIPVMLGATGLDFFFIDTEHSPTSYAQIQALCRAARAAGIVPLIRVAE
jgi:4-hydroxy-2-oxoheptanedioate aldolase